MPVKNHCPNMSLSHAVASIHGPFNHTVPHACILVCGSIIHKYVGAAPLYVSMGAVPMLERAAPRHGAEAGWGGSGGWLGRRSCRGGGSHSPEPSGPARGLGRGGEGAQELQVELVVGLPGGGVPRGDAPAAVRGQQRQVPLHNPSPSCLQNSSCAVWPVLNGFRGVQHESSNGLLHDVWLSLESNLAPEAQAEMREGTGQQTTGALWKDLPMPNVASGAVQCSANHSISTRHPKHRMTVDRATAALPVWRVQPTANRVVWPAAQHRHTQCRRSCAAQVSQRRPCTLCGKCGGHHERSWGAAV